MTDRPRRHDPEAPWGLTGVIKFRYSAGPMEDMLARCVFMTIDVTVVPSIHCTDFEVWPVKSEESICLLLFDAENKTSNDMELTYTLQKDKMQEYVGNSELNKTLDVLSIQANDSKKVAVCLPRFVLPVMDKNTKTNPQNRVTEYSQTIQQMLKLDWRLPACQASGSGTLDNLRLTEEMVEALKTEPLVFDVQLGQQPHKIDSHVTVTLGTALDVAFTVTNCSDIPYGPLRLNVEPYQDHDNGCHLTELNGQVAWVGTLQLYIPKLLPGEEFRHTCSFVFFYTGQFLISILCTDCSTGQFERPRSLRGSGACEMSSKHSRWPYPHPIRVSVVDEESVSS